MLQLTENIKKKIKDEALGFLPNECCGLIVKINGIPCAHSCENISTRKKEHVILNPLDYIRISQKGEIIGFYHSHQNLGTSVLDNFNAFSHNLFSVIYSWKFDIFYIIEPKLKTYLNKEFYIGKNDCFTLIRDYYKNELNIEIGDYNRDENWYDKNPKIILENFEKEGGIKIDLKDIKENDVIFFGIENDPSHMGIYLNGDYFLHHQGGKRSIIEELTNKWKNRIIMVARHKLLI